MSQKYLLFKRTFIPISTENLTSTYYGPVSMTHRWKAMAQERTYTNFQRKKKTQNKTNHNAELEPTKHWTRTEKTRESW